MVQSCLIPRKRRQLNACLVPGVCVTPDVEIQGMSLDSRLIEKGDLFIALKGTHQDGHAFADSALERGAVAILAERSIEVPQCPSSVPVIVDANLRQDLGYIAGRYFGEPSRSMWGCGVTGTNGKTSVAWYSAALLNATGQRTGFLGTTGWGIPPELNDSGLTTSDPITLQRRLADLLHRNSDCFVMEVSSHALSQQRINGVELKCAVFTNLSRDHLDYHSTLECYAEAKKLLFQHTGLKSAIINIDDRVGSDIASALPKSVRLLTFGRSPRADLHWTGLRFIHSGVATTLRSPWGSYDLELPLYGEFNVANVVAALGVALMQGRNIDTLTDATRTLEPAPGRMELFPAINEKGGAAVVDYAHTPDALAKALKALRPHTHGRLICVFGCGGNRDRGKRSLMAQAVEAHADMGWLTTDNPRDENPQVIIDEVLEGFSINFTPAVEPDRETAIRAALNAAGAGDTVLIAGKGHESYQEVGGIRQEFSDRDLVGRIREGR